MSMRSYERGKELLEELGGGDFEGAKPEALVAKAEAALGVVFPPSYRRFLLELGCGDINGVEFYGLVNDDFGRSTVPNGIWLTLSERRASGLDPQYVIIGDRGDGGRYALDTRIVDASRECPVVLLSINSIELERVADSFGSYFLSAILEGARGQV